MKVAYLVNQYPQPSHTFIRREIRQLEALGWTVVRYTLRATSSKLVDPDDLDEQRKTRAVLASGKLAMVAAAYRVMLTNPVGFIRGITLARMFAKPSGRGLLVHLIYLFEACVLLKWARDDCIKHVHAHFGTNSAAVAALLYEIGGPTYSFTSHGPEEYDMPIAISLGEKVRGAAFVVAISSFGRSQLCRWISPDQWSKVKVVHCGVDSTFSGSASARLPKEKRLLHVGRLSPQKAQALIVRAAAKLKRDRVIFTLDIIGDGEMRADLERLIAEHDVADRVKLLGTRGGAEVRAALDNCRVFVMPSFAEGLPVVIMEALSRHRPVIATAIAGIPELVKDGESGWLVPAGDENALAAAMRSAIDASDETLTMMGAIGAAKVMQNHNAATEAAKLAEYIKPLA